MKYDKERRGSGSNAYTRLGAREAKTERGLFCYRAGGQKQKKKQEREELVEDERDTTVKSKEKERGEAVHIKTVLVSLKSRKSVD